jgi:hypothetical protein
MEIRGCEDFPMAVSEEQIIVECLELDNSHSELKTPSAYFMDSHKSYYRASNNSFNY